MNPPTPSRALNLREQISAHLEGSGDLHEVVDLLTDSLWSLGEARPDLELLPSSLAEAQADIALDHDSTAALCKLQNVISLVISRYGDTSDRAAYEHSESRFREKSFERGGAAIALHIAESIECVGQLRNGTRRLALALHQSTLQVGRHAQVSFNRTLRIPEDGREYPLPAGFGALPILRVEDYASRVPEQWVRDGGFIIPLYQREALFLAFGGVAWRPNIAKVSVGRVNAVSGKKHDLIIRPHRQDYVVIPNQQWLDGISAGNGSVRQFVAMPLGQGYTVEAQVTDEEKHGGFQLVFFDPKSGRFAEADPKEQKVAVEKRMRRALDARRQVMLDALPVETQQLLQLLRTMHYEDVAKKLGRSAESILRAVGDLKAYFTGVLGERGFAEVVPPENLQPRVLRSQPLSDVRLKPRNRDMHFSPRTDGAPSPLAAAAPPGRARRAIWEMGIAAGGRIRQQIAEDEFGAESWDPDAYRNVVIHIVNSAVFQEITGEPPPPSPITIEQYQRNRIPWYSSYDEKIRTVGPAAVFRRIFSIGQIVKQRGLKEQDNESANQITEEDIIRVRVPTLEERVNALLQRAQQSLEAGRFKIAAREASLACDIIPSHPLPFLLRAHANLRLGLHADAEADASSCLERDPDNISALGVRALSSLALGETLLAKNDAEKVLESQPQDQDGLYVRAEANLRLAHYKDAVGDAEKILRKDPANRKMLRIRRAARTKLLEAEQAEPLAASTIRNSTATPRLQFSFTTLEQQLIETDDPSAWGYQRTNSHPFWIAVRGAAQRALREQSQSALFFQHHIMFFHEALLLEIPLGGSWDSEWLALGFESAFGFVKGNSERATELMKKVASEQVRALEIVDTFSRLVLHWPAHDHVRRAAEAWKSQNHQEGGGVKWLLDSVEDFFWAGIHAATEDWEDPETLEFIEFLDLSCTRRWGDSRLHINLLRASPFCCDTLVKETDHPMLRIAIEKYRNNLVEGRVIGDFLEQLCMKQELKNARSGLDSDLFVCQWVEEGLRFGGRLLEDEPHTFTEMLQTADGYSGDSVIAFYEGILSKVEDRTDPLNITRAFLDWQAEERDEVTPRYYGESLEILLNCIDAAIYLPWAEAARSK